MKCVYCCFIRVCLNGYIYGNVFYVRFIENDINYAVITVAGQVYTHAHLHSHIFTRIQNKNICFLS